MTTCNALTARIREFAEGELPAARAAEFAQHVAECAPCRLELERERSLAEALRLLPAAPETRITVPHLPPPAVRRSPRRVALAVALAAAATVLVAVRLMPVPDASSDPDGVAGLDRVPPVAAGFESGRVESGRVESGGSPIGLGRAVLIHRVVDAPERAPPAEDGLVALTAGVEAVVMRRPAQRR